ncbi:MAG: hypothetical protein U0169_25385 [Polyangiaceae bacterium]
MTDGRDGVRAEAGENVRREHARELGAGVVVALYRLFRLAQMHELGNQAFVRQLDQTHEAIVEYCTRAGSNLGVLFAKRAVFVQGQLMKGGRASYEAAHALGDLVEQCGGSELTIVRDVSKGELIKFAETFSQAVRQKGRNWKSPTPKIRVRAMDDAARLRGLELEDLSDSEKVVRSYATAVVIMRRFFEDLEGGHYAMPRYIKRVAQSLVELSEGGTPAFLGVTEARSANHDAAGRAVNTAILAVLTARQFTADRTTLAQIAMASLVFDVGRPRASALARVSGPALSDVAPKLTDDAEDRMPAGAAAVLTAMGRLNAPTVRRTVLAYEALALGRRATCGPVYRGARTPTLHAKIVAIARRYNDLLTPEPGLAAKLPDFAVATLAAEYPEAGDRTILRALVAALGLHPVGTVVELSSDEVAEVVFGSDEKKNMALPRVRIVLGKDGGVVTDPFEVDLSVPPKAGEPARRIRRVLSIEGWTKGKDGSRGAIAGNEFTITERKRLRPNVDEVVAASTRDRASLQPTPNPEPNPEEEAPLTPIVANLTNLKDVPPPAPSSGSDLAVSTASPKYVQAAERKGTKHASRPPVGVHESEPPSGVSGMGTTNLGRTITANTQGLTPGARGTLARTPLVHVLVYMLDRALTGSIVFREVDESVHVVHFEAGAPAKAVTARPITVLGDELISANVITEEALGSAIERAAELGLLLGEYLVGYELISRAQLDAALESQLFRRIASLVNLRPNTSYEFFQNVNLLKAIGAGDNIYCDPLGLVLACVRVWNDRARIDATLKRIEKLPLSIHMDADIDALPLTEAERKVMGALRDKPTTLSELRTQTSLDAYATGTLVYSLAVLRHVHVPGQSGKPMGKLKDARLSRVDGFPRHSLLPIVTAEGPLWPSMRKERAASVADVEKRASAHNLPVDLKEMVDDTPSEPPPSSSVFETMPPDPSNDFRLAEAALARSAFDEAVSLAEVAVQGDPEVPDYRALLAWAKSLGSGADAASESTAELTKILERHPACARALLYRGKLHKRTGRADLALLDFELLLELEPTHREAASEVRMLRIRLGKPA